MSWFWKSNKPEAPKPSPSAAPASRPHNENLRGAVEGLRRFRQQFAAERALYQKLAEGQKPSLLWIGCSDSRVVPEIITSSSPGQIFVVRNIANIVPPASSAENSTGAAVEYAVEHLGIENIVICGHTGCGGVRAMQEGLPGPQTHLHRWVGLGTLPPGLSALDAVKRNVIDQRDNLLTYPVVQERVSAGALAIHEWLYDMGEGEILAYDDGAEQWRTLGDADS